MNVSIDLPWSFSPSSVIDETVSDVLLAWKGTPHGYCQRSRGCQVDCADFVVGVLDELTCAVERGFEDLPPTLVGRVTHEDEVKRLLVTRYLASSIPRGVDLHSADVILFRGAYTPHLAIVGPGPALWHVTRYSGVVESTWRCLATPIVAYRPGIVGAA